MTEPCVFRHFVSLVDPALPQSGAGWANGQLVAEGYQSHTLVSVMTSPPFAAAPSRAVTRMLVAGDPLTERGVRHLVLVGLRLWIEQEHAPERGLQADQELAHNASSSSCRRGSTDLSGKLVRDFVHV